MVTLIVLNQGFWTQSLYYNIVKNITSYYAIKVSEIAILAEVFRMSWSMLEKKRKKNQFWLMIDEILILSKISNET